MEKEYSEVAGQLKSIFSLLGASDQGFSVEWVEQKRASLTEEHAKLQEEIIKSESAVSDAAAVDVFTLTEQQKAFRRVQDLQERLGKQASARSSLALYDKRCTQIAQIEGQEQYFPPFWCSVEDVGNSAPVPSNQRVALLC